MSIKAFLFDLNGTMINDMEYHINAWHKIFNNLGAEISLQRMKEECYGKNNEVIERILPGRFTEKEKNEMSYEKEKTYQKEFKPHLQLIAGLDVFLEKAYAKGIKMAIGSAAIMFNIDFVIDGLDIRNYFSSLISADDVTHSKPHPETFLKCAKALGVRPDECIVFEDAPKGVEAAKNAGMQNIVILNVHKKEEFAPYDNIISFIENYYDESLNSLLQ
jgi:beta-phosphoglucomutase